MQYPPDRTECQPQGGPKDERLRVSGGRFIYTPNRDARFPYLYEVDNHPQIVKTDLVKKIIVYVQNTDLEEMEKQTAFAQNLKVPLGMDSLILQNGKKFKAPYHTNH